MSKSVHCSIVSAEEQVLFSGKITTLVCTADQGELGIKVGHAPLLTRLLPGPVHLLDDNEGKETHIYVEGGFLEVQPNQITVLADTAVRAEHLDEAAALKSQKEAQEQFDKEIDHGYAEVALQMTRALAKLKTIRASRNGYR